MTNLKPVLELLKIISPTSVNDNTDRWTISGWNLARDLNLDTKNHEFCECVIKFGSNQITMYRYDETPHGSEFNKITDTFEVNQNLLDALIKDLKPRAIETLERKFKQEEQVRIANRYKAIAEQHISSVISDTSGED